LRLRFGGGFFAVCFGFAFGFGLDAVAFFGFGLGFAAPTSSSEVSGVAGVTAAPASSDARRSARSVSSRRAPTSE